MERGGHSRTSSSNHSAPLWKTREFIFYYAAIGYAIWMVFYLGYQYSSEERPHYQQYRHRLSPGWLMGTRPMDLSDGQFRYFRSNFLLMGAFFLIFTLLSRPLLGRHRLRMLIHLVIGLVFLAVLHGVWAIKVLSLVTGNYLLARTLGSFRFAPLVIWIYNIAVLFANEMDHWSFSQYHLLLSFLVIILIE